MSFDKISSGCSAREMSPAEYLPVEQRLLVGSRFLGFPERISMKSKCLCLLLLSVLPTHLVPGADQPQWGQAWSRNLVSAEIGLPDAFDPKSGRNIKWSARLGTETHSSPVIAGGRVYVGTNNGEPRDPKHKGDRGVLMCFDERTGKLLWQSVVPKRVEDIFHDWPNSGICSPPTVEGDHVYVVNNRGQVMCLDAQGMSNGNDGPFMDEGAHMTVKDANWRIPENEPVLTPGPLDADILWLCDLTTDAGIWSHDGAHSSILIDGDYLYLNTGTGVDNTHRAIRKPDAPSLVVLEKKTGRLIAREHEGIGPNIFHCTWSGPSSAVVKGQKLIFFNAGNGVVYAFEALPPGLAPESSPRFLKKVWQFDFDPTAPKENVHKYNSNRRESPSNFFGMPVFHENRIFVAGGGDIWWGKNEAWMKCIDATGNGDITRGGLVWSYPLEKHALATPTVSDGLAFVGDVGRTFHCVDIKTGQACWTHEVRGEIWASALVADGKVYVGTRGGSFYVFAAAREKQLLSELELGQPVSGTASAANGVLYITTMNSLYAVAQSK
jgi:outer membrane protein assembly factor BamB